MITIRFYSDSDRDLWDSYVMNHSQGTFFHLTGWKRVIEKTFGHRSFYLVAENSKSEGREALRQSRTSTESSCPDPDLVPQVQRSSIHPRSEIVGIFPLFLIKSLLFSKALVSLPFAAYGGILAESKEVADQLFEKAKEITQSENLDYLEMRNRDGVIPDLPVKDLYFRFQREILQDLNDNMEAIPRKSRRMVRVGEKEGLKWEFGQVELIPAFYEVFARSYHRLGSPVFPKSLFENLLQEFEGKSNVLLVRNADGRPIAGVLTFFHKDEVLPYYAGNLAEYRNLAPNDFMYWQLMKYAWEKGYKLFDFGRSKVDTGSYDFKRHWGFEPEPLKYQYYLNKISEIPNLSPANPKFKKKIELWQRLPFWATKIIGPRIVKYIP